MSGFSFFVALRAKERYRLDTEDDLHVAVSEIKSGSQDLASRRICRI